ncbi:DIP2B protein, partial [Atractosteus spatula]|nr:DIP2B protein [Atractosteus spatula]
MADRGVDLSALPKDVKDQLAELDLELSEGTVRVALAGRETRWLPARAQGCSGALEGREIARSAFSAPACSTTPSLTPGSSLLLCYSRDTMRAFQLTWTARRHIATGARPADIRRLNGIVNCQLISQRAGSEGEAWTGADVGRAGVEVSPLARADKSWDSRDPAVSGGCSLATPQKIPGRCCTPASSSIAALAFGDGLRFCSVDFLLSAARGPLCPPACAPAVNVNDGADYCGRACWLSDTMSSCAPAGCSAVRELQSGPSWASFYSSRAQFPPRRRLEAERCSHSDITQKGYEKKRAKLLAPYIPQTPAHRTVIASPWPPPACFFPGACKRAPLDLSGQHSAGTIYRSPPPTKVSGAPAELKNHPREKTKLGWSRNQRRGVEPGLQSDQRNQGPSPAPASSSRYHRSRSGGTRDDRYRSDIHTEAVQAALAKHKEQKMALPMPTKRRSTFVQSPVDTCTPPDTSSASEDEGSLRRQAALAAALTQGLQNADCWINRSVQGSSTSSSASSTLSHGETKTQGAALADVLAHTRLDNASAPPDVTSSSSSAAPERSSRVDLPPAVAVRGMSRGQSRSSMMDTADGVPVSSRVSTKIQQLLNTLKRPKRPPLKEFFVDDFEEIVEVPQPDPNQPKPEGRQIIPVKGEPLGVVSNWPPALQAALQRWGTTQPKSPALTALDVTGKPLYTLTYGKLWTRSLKLAYTLLNKLGTKNEPVLKPGDRVALVYPNSDPGMFMVAFYGCLLAEVIPVPIEVPLSRKDAGSQQIGFLLGSCGVNLALTSEVCLKGLPKTQNGEIVQFKGWPRLKWVVTDSKYLTKPSKDWQPHIPTANTDPAYIEYKASKEGSVMGVAVSRVAMLTHCQALTQACNYSEGETLVNVLDFKKDMGLWHAVLTSVMNRIHTVGVPYAVMKACPLSWVQRVHSHKARVALVKCRDLHWAMMAHRDQRDTSLSSLRMLIVADGANPWSVSSCDAFLNVFQSQGLKPEVICPCASSPEALTVAIRRYCCEASAGALMCIVKPDGPRRSEEDVGAIWLAARGVMPAVWPGVAILESSNRLFLSLSRPGVPGAPLPARAILSMSGLSYSVIRVNTEDKNSALTVQDVGHVMPGALMCIVKPDGPPQLCKTDEIGEICVNSRAGGTMYYGLPGVTKNTFEVIPVNSSGAPVGDIPFVRSGLLGFVGPGSLVFVVGRMEGLLMVSGRRHNADDLVATALAVEPVKTVYRGRIVVFGVTVFYDERIVVVAEQRPDASEEDSFQWMSRVLQAIDSIHQVGLYCLALVPANTLPKTPLGGIHVSETKQHFLDGTLHPCNILMCPHTCVTNLPKPRQKQPAGVGPASVMLGNLVAGKRVAQAAGRDLGLIEDQDLVRKASVATDSTPSSGVGQRGKGPVQEDTAAQHKENPGRCCRLKQAGSRPSKTEERNIRGGNSGAAQTEPYDRAENAGRHQYLSEALQWRAHTDPDHILFVLLNAKGAAVSTATCVQLHKRAEKIAAALMERGSINTGDNVVLLYPPGIDLIASFYGCLYAGCIPVTVRPPHPQNLAATLPTVRMIIDVSKAACILTTQVLMKTLRSKEAAAAVNIKTWPTIIDTDDLPRRRPPQIYRPPTAEMMAYLDFSVSTTGMLTGVKISHAAVSALCRSIKLQCELYSSRQIAICLDPYCGLGFVLWCLCSVYAGHQSILIPPMELEGNLALWLSTLSQHRIRDTFCSYSVMEMCTKGLGTQTEALKARGLNLSCVRSCVVVAEERPRLVLSQSFSKLFKDLGLSPRAVSTSFGSRVNLAICLQGTTGPDPSTVYVDMKSLRHDRVRLVERGAPQSLPLTESGTILPGVRVVIVNTETRGPVGDSHLGEVWVNSPHSASGYYTIYGDESLQADHFNTRLSFGDTQTLWARTGYLGFVRRTELLDASGDRHDALFVVGSLDETLELRGLRYHPIDIETSVSRAHRSIAESAVFTWTNLLVVVSELCGSEQEALDLVPLVTNVVLEEHHLIVGVVVVVDPGVIPINSRGEKQRMHLRDSFLADQLDPIYVAYNM